jgi:hypothetical protein
MTTGTRREPAAERRELERLREVPQRQPVFLQLGLQRRPQHPRLDPGGPARRIDLQHLVQVLEIQRDDPVQLPRLDPTNHGSAATEGNHRHVVARTPVEHVDHVLLGARPGHGVRQRPDVAGEVAGDVAVGLAAGVREPVDGIGRADVARRLEAGIGQVQRQRVRWFVERQVRVRQHGPDPLDQRTAFIGGDGVLDGAPAPPRPRCHGEQP